MPQKYALYFNRKAILFNNLQGIQPQANILHQLEGSTENTLVEAIQTLKASEDEGFRIFLPDLSLDEGIKLLKNNFKFLIAAGGVVLSPTKEILAIYRLGCWDLPKGKVEPEENIEDAAEREIIEETGISSINNRAFLTKTYHSYELKGKTIIKETWWFSFNSKDSSKLIPQTEEDITEAKWISLKEIEIILNNTYPSIEDVIHEYLQKITIS
jgi:8-oxo-dGTP pyrophosphatase MutT (NUDIX family)